MAIRVGLLMIECDGAMALGFLHYRAGLYLDALLWPYHKASKGIPGYLRNRWGKDHSGVTTESPRELANQGMCYVIEIEDLGLSKTTTTTKRLSIFLGKFLCSQELGPGHHPSSLSSIYILSVCHCALPCGSAGQACTEHQQAPQHSLMCLL